MAQVKERGGGGEERKVYLLPLPSPLFHFLALVSFLARSKPKIPFLVFFCSETERKTLATQATIQAKLIFNKYNIL